MCTFGLAPSQLLVLPINRMSVPTPAANILDNIPIVNIVPFGMCCCPGNPAVAAATAAAMGVLTPMPCLPVTPAPWTPGAPTVILGQAPSLDNTSQLMCTWGGVITIVVPGQMQMTIP